MPGGIRTHWKTVPLHGARYRNLTPDQMAEVVHTLGEIRALTITVMVALQRQAGDYDQDFAEVLRGAVIFNLERVIHRLAPEEGPDSDSRTALL